MTKGDFLNPHIDNSHNINRDKYRRLNLLYYVTPGWVEDNGGNFELWDNNVSKPKNITSLFNRMVIMETTRNSWHSVNKIISNQARCCVSNYYFSNQSPTGKEYFNITSFNGRPEQKALRFFSKIDNYARGSTRLIFKKGVGRNDIFVSD